MYTTEVTSLIFAGISIVLLCFFPFVVNKLLRHFASTKKIQTSYWKSLAFSFSPLISLIVAYLGCVSLDASGVPDGGPVEIAWALTIGFSQTFIPTLTIKCLYKTGWLISFGMNLFVSLLQIIMAAITFIPIFVGIGGAMVYG